MNGLSVPQNRKVMTRERPKTCELWHQTRMNGHIGMCPMLLVLMLLELMLLEQWFPGLELD